MMFFFFFSGKFDVPRHFRGCIFFSLVLPIVFVFWGGVLWCMDFLSLNLLNSRAANDNLTGTSEGSFLGGNSELPPFQGNLGCRLGHEFYRIG